VVQAAGNGFAAAFAGAPEPATYLVATGGTLSAPSVRLTRTSSDLERPAQYLVIAHPDFIAGIQPLVSARENRGLSVNVVDVNDLYARYSSGVVDPQAIKQYIAYAARNLGTRSVLLVGGDTYDYRNYLGRNSISFIPSLYAATGPQVRFVPSDALYADLEDDGVPDLAIGRFPVRTSAELATLVSKTLAYEGKAYGRTAVFVADKRDGGLSFERYNDGFIGTLPGIGRVWRNARGPADPDGIDAIRIALADVMVDLGIAFAIVAHEHEPHLRQRRQHLLDAGGLIPHLVNQWVARLVIGYLFGHQHAARKAVAIEKRLNTRVELPRRGGEIKHRRRFGLGIAPREPRIKISGPRHSLALRIVHQQHVAQQPRFVGDFRNQNRVVHV